jgi:RNA polymerase sigma-70 factor (ECF subfamily)
MTFDQIYRQYYVQIYKFCFRFTGNSEVAGDLTQDTFLKLYLRMKNGNEMIDNPKSWLYRVASNNCMNSVKKWIRRKEIVNDVPLDNMEVKNPESIFLDFELKQLLQHSLELLRPELKVLVLMYGDGLSYAEMAEATGIPLNSIGKTLWRSIEKLAKEIKKYEYGQERTIS